MIKQTNPSLIPDFNPDDLKVGQIWEMIEDKKQIVLISLVRPKELRGFLFNGFEVVPYISFAPYDFCKYWRMIKERI